MNKLETVSNFNHVLLDLLDNVSMTFPDAGLGKYKIAVRMDQSDRWVRKFMGLNISPGDDINLEDFGLGDIDFDKDHKAILDSYIDVLNSLLENYNIA